MPFDTDALLDRRMLRRRVTFWRAIAIGIAVIAVGAIGFVGAQRAGLITGGDHVARVDIKGFIAQDAELYRLLDRLGNNAQVRGVVVNIDSPGGTVAGSEALYHAVRTLAAKKPVVGLVEGTAASGGYIAAIATDHIVARETAITGSIGVIVQFPNVVRLLETLGVRVEAVRSAPLKAQPSGVEPTSPEALAALNEIVVDSYGWFRRLVKERRSLTDDEVRVASDGRVFSGSRARTLKLVDTIGGEGEARTWLADQRQVSRDLPIRTYRPRRENQLPFVNSLAVAFVDAMGLDGLGERLRASGLVQTIERSSLDGLLAVWQPPTP
ncbi:MAG: signal peptide peptidase SppA [Alphaproteobacteria bacterium]